MLPSRTKGRPPSRPSRCARAKRRSRPKTPRERRASPVARTAAAASPRPLGRGDGRAPLGCRSSRGRPRSRRRRGSSVRQRRRALDALELRREDRPDRPRIDRLVGVPAGPLVDRADVEAGLQRMHASVCRPTWSASTSVRPASSEHDVEDLRAVPGRDAGPERRVRVHPLAGRRARKQLEEDLEILRNRGTSFSIPTTVMSVSGSVVQKRPLPSDSTMQTVPVSATAKLAPLIPTRARRNRSRRWRRAASASSRARRRDPAGRARGGRGRGSRRGSCGSPGRGCATTPRRRAGRSARRGRSRARRSRRGKRSFRRISSVVSDFTFTTSRSPVAAHEVCDDAASPPRRRAPSAPAAGLDRPPPRTGAGSVEVPQRLVLDRTAGLAELLPVGPLRDDRGALRADRVRRDAEVAPKLLVAERLVRAAGSRPSLLGRQDLGEVHGSHARSARAAHRRSA